MVVFKSAFISLFGLVAGVYGKGRALQCWSLNSDYPSVIKPVKLASIGLKRVPSLNFPIQLERIIAPIEGENRGTREAMQGIPSMANSAVSNSR